MRIAICEDEQIYRDMLKSKVLAYFNKVDADNYPLFEDMIFWRENGYERAPAGEPASEQIKRELANPDLYIYAAMTDNRFVGWISLVYIPKVGKWNGHGTGSRLYVSVDNRSAKALYEKSGFREEGHTLFMEK